MDVTHVCVLIDDDALTATGPVVTACTAIPDRVRHGFDDVVDVPATLPRMGYRTGVACLATATGTCVSNQHLLSPDDTAPAVRARLLALLPAHAGCLSIMDHDSEQDPESSELRNYCLPSASGTAATGTHPSNSRTCDGWPARHTTARVPSVPPSPPTLPLRRDAPEGSPVPTRSSTHRRRRCDAAPTSIAAAVDVAHSRSRAVTWYFTGAADSESDLPTGASSRGIPWVMGSQLLRVNRRNDPPFRHVVNGVYSAVQRARLRRAFLAHVATLPQSYRHELMVPDDHWAAVIAVQRVKSALAAAGIRLRSLRLEYATLNGSNRGEGIVIHAGGSMM